MSPEPLLFVLAAVPVRTLNTLKLLTTTIVPNATSEQSGVVTRRRGPAPVGLSAVRLLFGILGRVAPGLMSRWAYRLWFKTRRFPKSPRETEVLNTAQRRTVEHDGHRLATYVWGNGPTVLMVHGWHGYSGHFVDFVEPLIHAGFRVVAFDAPAHGDTPGTSTSLPEIAKAMMHLAAQFGPLHAVVTHSFGTPCVTYALSQGLKTERVVCLSPPARIETMFQTFCATLGLPDPVVARFRRRFESDFGEDLWERFSPENQASEFSMPGLMIHDVNDRAVPIEEAEHLARVWPGARLIRTQSLGHRRILSDPKVIQQTIAFLTER